MNTSLSRICIALVLVFITTHHRAQAATNAWYADSGLLPSQTTTNWSLSDTSPSFDPSISGSVMTLATSANAEGMFFRQTANLAIPSNWTIEFRAKLDSRTTAINFNSGMSVFFTAAPSVGNILYFRADEIWLSTALNTRGPSVVLDTDSAFHTYRIEMSGTTLGSAVRVYYDNGASPVLAYQLVSDPSLVGSVARIGFGDATAGDSAVTEWEYFWHNGSSVSVVPEPTSLSLIGCAAMMFFATRRTH